MRHISLCVSGGNQEVEKGKLSQSKVQPSKEVGDLVVVGGAQDLDLEEGVTDTRGVGGDILRRGGPQEKDTTFNAGIRSNFQRKRSLSLYLLIGEEEDQELGLEEPIANFKIKKRVQRENSSRGGRHPKQGGKAKPPVLGVPKFIQLAEAMRLGGGKQRRKKEARVSDGSGQSRDNVENSFSSDSGNSNQRGVIDTVVPDSQVNGNLEVVLPLEKVPNSSGINLLLTDECDIHQHLEATKLLEVQKTVGFCYDKSDGEVIKELLTDEVRDRTKKVEWEQKQGYQ
ncbi:hypothetical protein A2U01_0001681 [Trifolium medium]|uniref:Uncharacterized protein n=1 Tax=Trifolium medium TaxID=97028 RepID=A0A392M0X1_9FABA|nr:hypothetical protein [Trifolium medium]